MQLNDLLKVGEVIEVKGQKVKAGIYKDKNSTYLNYNGEIIKNIGIGGYIAIRKGFLNIVGKVEGEYIKEQETADDFEIKGNNINRIIEISILGSINNDKFTHGLVELPLIGNYIYVVEEKDLAKILSFGNGKKLTLGYLIDYPEFPFKVSLQDLICSHIGIFGNTGSGKSNTLARLYTEVFNLNKTNSKFHKNSEFIFMDFNGEYINTFPTAEIYTLSTRNIRNCNKYPLKMNEIFEVDFWAIVLEATDKTQKPFIKRTLSKFKSMRNEGFNFSKKDLASLVLNSQEHYFDLKYNLEEIFEIANLKDSFFHFEEEIKYNSKLRKFYTNEVSYNTYSQPNWEISFDMVYRALFKEEEIDETNLDLNLPTPFIEFRFMLNYYYCIEISKGYIAQHHIGPILARSSSKIEDLEKIFNEQLEKTGVKYFDYYLLHNINENTYPVLKKFPCFDFLLKLKNEKKVKKIGFSFHGSPEMLEQVLHDYPFVDFVQLQINYLDWESKVIQAKKCYEIAANKYNKDIIVMETIKGGYLANLQKDIAKTLLEYNPNMSLASWAVRYVASLPKVIIALSGMSSLEQLKDNLSYMKDFVPLNDIELQLIQKVVEQLNSLTYIPCTACNYCKEGCPKKIAIPEYFSLYNSYKQKTIDNFS